MIILFLLQALTKRKTKSLYLLNIPLYIINIPLPPSSPSSGHAFSLHFPCALHPLQGDKDDSGLLSAHSPPTLKSRPFTSSPTRPVQLHNTACFDMQCILMGIFRAEMVLKTVESQIWVRLTHFILVGWFVSLLRVHAVKCVSREAQDVLQSQHATVLPFTHLLSHHRTVYMNFVFSWPPLRCGLMGRPPTAQTC